MRGHGEIVCVNAYEKLGSVGARVHPVLSLAFTSLVKANQTDLCDANSNVPSLAF